jgi:DNA-directed RNA polymerase specialized sigma24 family protein
MTAAHWDQARMDHAGNGMEALPPGEREALLLWNGGLGYGEIAARTGQSSDAVGILLGQARNRLVMADDLLGG